MPADLPANSPAKPQFARPLPRLSDYSLTEKIRRVHSPERGEKRSTQKPTSGFKIISLPDLLEWKPGLNIKTRINQRVNMPVSRVLLTLSRPDCSLELFPQTSVA